MEKRFVYADNAATTRPYPEVIEAMMPYFENIWGNPSSLHSKGREAKVFLDKAREKAAEILGCEAKEIYFTSGGTESDNWAIKGASYANKSRGNHIITSKIEHKAVLNCVHDLQKDGFEATYLDVNPDGTVNPDSVRAAICPDTVLVTVMYANNEIGTVMPIKEIASVCHEKGVLFFTDAVQAFGNIPVSLKDIGADMLSLSGHKFHAPKGIGLLYIKRGTKTRNLISGGGHENGKRAGTENLPYIIGLVKALEIAQKQLGDTKRIIKMRDRLIGGILEKVPYSSLNGSREKRLPGNASLTFEYIEGEGLLLLLDIAGICVSAGSACSASSQEPSHVLTAIGLTPEKARGTLRFSLSHDNTDEDIEYILEKLPPTVEKLRSLNPLYK